MKMGKTLASLAVAGGLALLAMPAFAQYPGMGGGMGGPPAGMSGPPAGMGGGGGFGGPGAQNGGQVVVTRSDETTSSTLPKTGGDPLSVAAAGSLLLTAGYAVRRRFQKA